MLPVGLGAASGAPMSSMEHCCAKKMFIGSKDDSIIYDGFVLPDAFRICRKPAAAGLTQIDLCN